MIITDKRISADFNVQLEVHNKISCDVLQHWLSPFFSVQNGNVLTSHIITKIEVKADIEEDYLYYDNTFYVNASMQLNRLLYTLMSILRMLFKYVAFLSGYQNLHAACLKYKDDGILVRANRNQGKTTMLLNAIQDDDFLLLANDQVMYNIDDNRVLGYPAAVGIRDNSCDIEKQKVINERALWFIDDPFQTNQKPVVHIKDLSQIYQCHIAESTNLSILINYEKSMRKEELIINNIGRPQMTINSLILPFEKTYNDYLLESCRHAVEHYMHKAILLQSKEKNDNNISILQVNVKCGLARINDMLDEIKSILS